MHIPPCRPHTLLPRRFRRGHGVGAPQIAELRQSQMSPGGSRRLRPPHLFQVCLISTILNLQATPCTSPWSNQGLTCQRVKPRRTPAFGPARHWRFAGGAFTPPVTAGMRTPPWHPSLRFPALTGGASMDRVTSPPSCFRARLPIQHSVGNTSHPNKGKPAVTLEHKTSGPGTTQDSGLLDEMAHAGPRVRPPRAHFARREP